MIRKLLLTGVYTEGLKKAFSEYGIELLQMQGEFNGAVCDSNTQIVKQYREKEAIDAIFSFDFVPGIAEACYQTGILYISWVWDCPHTTLWHKVAFRETNYIFLFDYLQYVEHLDRGMNRVWHLPLSPDVDGFQDTIKNDDGKSKSKYESDVTFLGNIYNDDKHGLYDQIKYLPPYVKGYLEGLMEAQQAVWGYDLVQNGIDETIWGELRKYVKWDVGSQYEDGVYEKTMLDIINKKIAQIERKKMCQELARRFDFSLYSGADTSFDPVIRNKGYALYDTQMPLIFHYSKINIHITVRSITSAVPLRVMDVLACGGFLLTNYQPEIVEYFEDGKDLVIYESLDDLYEKIAYYLEHEEERKQIALSGLKKVKKLFHFRKQIGKMLETIEGNEL